MYLIGQTVGPPIALPETQQLGDGRPVEPSRASTATSAGCDDVLAGIRSILLVDSLSTAPGPACNAVQSEGPVPSSFTARGSWVSTACALVGVACGPHTTIAPRPPVDFTIPFERYTLDNGLEVVLHENHSDPIVAVVTIVHAGSSRDRPGRTGLAHLYQQISFNDSENVPRGANWTLIPELGGIRNGRTSTDMTVYYEVVPSDAFEKILWIDSDRLGYMINTVTEAALEREKHVAKNERRQRIDNVPYGHTQMVQRAALYSEEHPYHWPVIGSLDDLESARVEDLQSLYSRLYGTTNATLAIVGDIDIDETKRRVDYWFGEISPGREVRAPYPQPVYLETSRSLMYEDNFATLPELQVLFPTVEQFHEDQYPLDILAELLASNKRAPLYEVIVDDRQLAPHVTVRHRAAEVAGELVIRVRANAGTDLDAVKAAIDNGLARFEREGVDAIALERVKARTELELHDGMGTVLGKAFLLAEYNEFTGDPGYLNTVAQQTLAVTARDVMAVYERYLKDATYVMTSFVPRGWPDLAVAGAKQAPVVEEQIIQAAEAEVSQGDEARYYKTATKADRSEPPLGDLPLVSAPPVWQTREANGLSVYGIETGDEALVGFDLTIPGGQLLDPPGQTGVASLLASLMMEGTDDRTPAELEETVDLLGARIGMSAGREAIRLSGSTLARTFEPTMGLLAELLLEPRWDRTEFARLRRELATRLRDREASPAAIASDVFFRLLYGEEHVFGTPVSGAPNTIADIELDDLIAYYDANLSPGRAAFHVVGNVSPEQVSAALASLTQRWPVKPVSIPARPTPPAVAGQTVYFVDVPGAKQSVLQVGRLALAATDPDFARLTFANERLGGSSSGRLFQLLRIENAYTYGVTSGIAETLDVAPWVAQTSVRANVTLGSLELLREQIQSYASTFTEDDVEVTKNQIFKGHTRAFLALRTRSELQVASGRRCIPPVCVARRSHTPGMRAPRAWSGAGLDAQRCDLYF